MDTLLQNEREKRPGKFLPIAILIAILVVAGLVGLLYLKPTTQEVKQQILDGAFLEGTPEFETLTRKIIIFNDAPNTMESPTGLGTITMFPRATIRNNSDKRLAALQIRVSVVDPFDKPIKEKTQIVVPSQDVASFPPNENITVTVPIEGFKKEDDRARVRWKVTAIKVEN